jgi:hypothetical protein
MVAQIEGYVEPKVVSEFQQNPSQVSLRGGIRTLAVIGKGSPTNLFTEIITKGTKDGMDVLSKSGVTDVLALGLTPGGKDYTKGTQFQITSDKIDWSLTAVLDVPVMNPPILKEGVGSWSGPFPQTMYWVVTAVNSYGETIKSATVNVSIPSASKTVLLSWSPIPRAASYKLYRNTADVWGVGSLLVATVTGTSYTDTGAATSGTFPPSTNTASDEPDVGAKYYVTYTYSKTADDMKPKLYFSYDDIVRNYGAPSLDNTISLAAYIAFEQGTSQMICAQVADDTYDEFKARVDQLELPVSSVKPYYIVPLTSTVTVKSVADQIRSYIKQHVVTQSDILHGQERQALFGFPTTTTVEQFVAYENAYKNERVQVFIPGSFTKTMTIAGVPTDLVLDSTFLAVMYAAKASTLATQEPMTHKSFVGIKDMPVYTKAEMDLMASNGGTIIVFRNGNYIVRHALTTDPTNANTQSPNIVQVKDAVINDVRMLLEDLYIGGRLDDTTAQAVKNTVESILTREIALGRITKKGAVVAKRNTLEPRQIDVTFSILPVYSLDWIYVTWTIDLGLIG